MVIRQQSNFLNGKRGNSHYGHTSYEIKAQSVNFQHCYVGCGKTQSKGSKRLELVAKLFYFRGSEARG